jgi:hypothetical protein
MPWPFDDKPVPPHNAMMAFRNGGQMPAPPQNAMAAALLGKQTTPFPSDFFPQLPPLPQGEIRNAMERPYDRFARPVAETLSPTLGGYGMGQLAGDTAMRASEGDYSGAAQNLPMLAMAVMPGLKGKGVGLKHVPGLSTPGVGGADIFHLTHPETGRPLGSMWVSNNGDTLHINSIERRGGTPRPGDPNSLGPEAMRSIMHQLSEFYPDAKTIEGNRISGARQGGQFQGDMSPEDAPLASAPIRRSP